MKKTFSLSVTLEIPDSAELPITKESLLNTVKATILRNFENNIADLNVGPVQITGEIQD